MQVRLFRPMARWVPLYMFLVGEMIFVTILEQLFNKGSTVYVFSWRNDIRNHFRTTFQQVSHLYLYYILSSLYYFYY